MLDITDILEELENTQRQERKEKLKEWVKMRLKDLRNLIKMAKNSGMDLKKATLKEVLESLRG